MLIASNMLVYPRDGSTQTRARAATLKQKLQIKLSFSLSHSILTPGQPVLALTLNRQAPGREASAAPMFNQDVNRLPLYVVSVKTLLSTIT